MPIEFFYIVFLIQNSSYLTISRKKKYHSAQSFGFKELRDTVKGQRRNVALYISLQHSTKTLGLNGQ